MAVAMTVTAHHRLSSDFDRLYLFYLKHYINCRVVDFTKKSKQTNNRKGKEYRRIRDNFIENTYDYFHKNKTAAKAAVLYVFMLDMIKELLNKQNNNLWEYIILY